jgi:hypothetical protein
LRFASATSNSVVQAVAEAAYHPTFVATLETARREAATIPLSPDERALTRHQVGWLEELSFEDIGLDLERAAHCERARLAHRLLETVLGDEELMEVERLAPM